MSRRILYTCWITCVTLAAAGLTALAHADAIRREIGRVRADAQSTVPAAQMAGVTASLGRAEAAADAGRVLQALYELQPAWESQAAFAFSAASGVTTEEQFEAKWKAIGEPRAVPPDSRRRALFVEALAQGAEGKASATYRASLPYAQDAGLMGGLYYLGESQAFGKFAAFCRSLEMAPAGPAPRFRSLDAELTTLERDILTAYASAEGSARPPFITISVTLKLARHLNEEGHRPGALLQYLLTRYRFALARSAAESPADLPQRLAAARNFAPDADHSIAQFFLQLADTRPQAAIAIVDDVLPAYHAVIK